MKQKITLLLLLIYSLITAQTNCSNAFAISPGYNQQNVSFLPGSQPPAPVCTTGLNNNPTMGAWFSYTALATHTVTINTAIPGPYTSDTRVHVYTGTCGNLNCITGDDDSAANLAAFATFTSQPGVTYYIAFDNNWSDNPFRFTLTESPYIPELDAPFTIQQVAAQVSLCIVDLNGDYLDDLVTPSGMYVNALYQNPEGGFTPATIPVYGAPFSPSWSMAAGDYDNNGFNDLLLGDNGGASILLADATGSIFDRLIHTPRYVFSQRTNFVDINNDGNLDAFICHDIAPNVYFLNDGNAGSTFHQGGLGDYPSGGNYGSIWVDYDNDGDSDLFIAKCRGANDPAAIDELHRNNGDGTFTNVAQEAGLADYSQAWSAAWADFDNDGDMDVLIGSSIDITVGHKLMRNNGNGTFTNITRGSGFEIQSFNVEQVAHDFDNDGYADVLGGGNRIMHNNGNMTFTPMSIAATNGPVGDLNNDGFLDIQNNNIVYMNRGNNNHWLKVHLQGIQSNRNGIGARVEVYAQGNGWTKQIRDVRSGDGFKYMSSLNTHFGLGTTNVIEKLVIKWPSGAVDVIENPNTDTAILVVEGAHPLGLENEVDAGFTLYPNPAKDVLNIKSTTSFTVNEATIYSIDSKVVKTITLSNNTIPVQHLAKGIYIITLNDKNGNHYTTKFIKE